jgi:DUF4097 and DUF4098 domain-containing protein YvlB
LRINAHGPVTLEAGASGEVSYSVKVSVSARSEAEARRVLDVFRVRAASEREWTVLTVPGGRVATNVTVRAPRLTAAEVSTSEGAVSAAGIDGSLTADTRAGSLYADRVRGSCRLVTGGGDIRVGRVEGSLRCTTGGGHIVVQSAGGETVLETNGGDIEAADVGGPVTAQTAGGSVRIGRGSGPVTATTGGGQIVIDKAAGLVTARNMAGPVRVGAAAGVRCESGNGGIHLSNITGSMRVSTAWGSIFATLMRGVPADSYLATGNGDITVTIPSNVGVTIQAENAMGDTVRRIVSEFPAIPVRRQGMRVVAEGPVNGGGPVLRLSDTGGTIFIKRQR